jgi:TonB family protein
MREIIVSGCFLLGACAVATTPELSRPGSQRDMPTFTLHEGAATDSVDARPAAFPARATPARLARAEQVRAQLGRVAIATRVVLCVDARGAIGELRVDESSGNPRFDAAVLADVSAWRYAPFAAPDRVRVCEPMTIEYAP